MTVLRCKMCGGNLIVTEGTSVVECDSCGGRQTIPSLDDERKLALYSRANRLRFACEFDKAAGIYEALAGEFPEESEAYWGLVLCKYGIEYVDDPATGRKVPTCHRSSFDSVLEDSNFEQALENADILARRVLHEEARAIEELRKGILTVSSKEAPYDIFICYKETDENGQRTIDSVLAQNTYDALVDRGCRVFFSRVTLEAKLGRQYEPYIFAALNSAKIMLVFGTQMEYFNAVWVKNEWSRFLKLMAKDKDKYLIPCYKDMDAYSMPKEFRPLQAQDMGKVGALQDLLRGVDKLLPRGKGQESTRGLLDGDVKISDFLKRGIQAMENRRWQEAVKIFDKITNLDPGCSPAYLARAMAGWRVTRLGEIEAAAMVSKTEFVPDTAFYEAVEHADEESRQRLLRIKARYDRERSQRQEAQRLSQQKREQEQDTNGQKQRQEDLAKREALRAKRRVQLQSYLTNFRKQAISWGLHGYAYIRQDGTLGGSVRNYSLEKWRDLVKIAKGPYTGSAGNKEILGLRADGRVYVQTQEYSYQPRLVEGWYDIVDIVRTANVNLAVRSDGQVLVDQKTPIEDINKISGWTNVVQLEGCGFAVCALRRDGTVLTNVKNYNCDVSQWNNIVAISMGDNHLVGLRRDGTVVAARGKDMRDQDWGTEVSGWKNIVYIEAGTSLVDSYTIGVDDEGHVHTAGIKLRGSRQENVMAAYGYELFLEKSGRLMHVRYPDAVLKLFEGNDMGEKHLTERYNRSRTLRGQIAQVMAQKLTLQGTIQAMQNERSSLGLFSGRRKKELDEQIAGAQEQLQRLEKMLSVEAAR